MAVRASQVAAEVIRQGTGAVRASQTVAEVLRQGTGSVLSSQTVLEVLHSVAEGVYPDVQTYSFAAQNVDMILGFSVPVDVQTYSFVPEEQLLVWETYRNISFASLNNTDHLDWGTEETPAFFNTCQSLDEPSLKTQVPYIYTFLKEGDANSDGAFVEAHWDWITPVQAAAGSPRAQDPEQIYIFRNGLLVGAKKTRMRGKGRSFHLQFTSDGHKAFNILGWAVFYDTLAQE